MGWIYGLVAIAVAAAGYAVVETYNHAITRAENAEQNAEVAVNAYSDQLDQTNKLLARNKALDAQLVERNKRQQAQAEEERKRDEHLDSTIAADPVAKRWATIPVPPSVLAELRGPAGKGAAAGEGGSAGGAAGGVHGPDAGAGLPRHNDQRGPGQIQSAPAGPPANVQRGQI
jgi:hypothetical protein